MTSYRMYWGTLIDAGKKPSPLLEQLCLGLAEVIGDLEPGTSPDKELTPCRLATFYKSCGGDFDELFKQTSSHGLSLIYKTIGCVHSLQPTTPYETPSIPCLKPLGYLRWQTIQLQLDPAEHAPFLQKAVSLYDVPKPDGSIFPKHIPIEAFPSQPDKEIEDWWKSVTFSMNQGNHMRRLGNAPYRSPPENSNGIEYFAQSGRLSASAAQRPYRSSRQPSEDRAAEAQRRSSVPDLVFSRDGDSRPGSKGKTSRSRSAQRISSGPYHHPAPSHPAGSSRHPFSTLSHLNASLFHRPSTSGCDDLNRHRRHGSASGHSTPRRRNRSPSTINESTGSEDSSGEPQSAGDRKTHEDRRRDSLWPPSSLHHRRRHSHDATYEMPERAPPLPPRPPPLQTHVPRTEYSQLSPPSAIRRRGHSNLNNVQFRHDLFAQEKPTTSASETPIAPDHVPSQASAPRTRYEPPPPNMHMHLLQDTPLPRATSTENSHEDPTRRFGAPTRSKTVALGEASRRYAAHGEPRNTTSQRQDRTMSAVPIGMARSG